MTSNRNEGDGDEFIRLLRARLVASEARDRNFEQMPAQALMQFPHHYQRVILGLEGTGLLSMTAINYADDQLRRVDFAWPDKLIGLRVKPEAALCELGWLILSIDPYSSNFEEQLERVASVVKLADTDRGPVQ